MITESPLVDWSIAVAAVLGALALVWRAWRVIGRAWNRVDEFLQDWNGTPERAGHRAIPSMPDRMVSLESAVEELRRGPPASARGRPNR